MNSLPTEIPCYITKLRRLMECFQNKGDVETVIEMTDKDFNNENSSLAQNELDPYLLRFLMKTQKGFCVFILDFRKNKQFSVLPWETKESDISSGMEAKLEEGFGFRYDRKTSPVISPRI